MTKEELLYHYFSNSLSTEQKKQFDELLENDTEFKKQFEFEKDLKRAIKHKEQQKLKAKLKGFESELKTTKGSSNYKFWLVAASFALLLSVSWYFYNSSSTNFNSLYTSNYEKYPNTIYAITRDTTVDTSIEYSAFEAYEASNYQESIILFTELKESKNPEYVNFYLAQSYLNNDQLDKAIALFTDISTHKKEFSSESHWYLALVYLKNNKKEKAIKALEDLIKDGTYKKDEAILLLEKLQ